MLTPKRKRHIQRIIPFGIIWFVFSIIYELLEKGLLGDSLIYPSTGNPYNFGINFPIVVIFSTLTGLVIGSIEVLYLSKLFTRQSFGKKLVLKTLIYIGLMISFLMISTILSNTIELKTNVFDPGVWSNLGAFISNLVFWSVMLYISALVIISIFVSEVSDNLGQGVLLNFFVGKYHRPLEEERIFMFLDMKSSTTISEKLGHVKYFEMLKSYYADLSDPIIEYAGEIYQYVGDEIVVSWSMENGLNNQNCLKCFFAMKAALANQSQKYLETYGVQPTFKAGFHGGKVTAGEIGVIKKEIIFTGDVLNTTARIQGLCNSYNVDILVSEQLMKKMSPNAFESKALGESKLRGRDEKVSLFTIL